MPSCFSFATNSQSPTFGSLAGNTTQQQQQPTFGGSGFGDAGAGGAPPAFGGTSISSSLIIIIIQHLFLHHISDDCRHPEANYSIKYLHIHSDIDYIKCH